MSMELIDEINLRVAEIEAMEPYTVADLERDKFKPNRDHFDPTVFEDDDDRWGE